MRRAEPLLLALTLLLATPGALLASDPAVEAAIRRQDAVDLGKDGDRLLTLALAAVSREDTAENRFLLGRAYSLLGRFERAREQFERSLEKDPTCAYAYVGLGSYHAWKGSLGEAEKQLRNALRLDPKLSLARFELVGLLMRSGDRRGAERELLTILEQDPDHFRARRVLADYYFQTRRYKKAVHEYRVLVEKRPKDRDLRKAFCRALMHSGKTDEAIREAERIIEADPKNPDGYRILATLMYEKRDVKGVIKALERLLAVLPEDSPLAKEVREEIDRLRQSGEEERWATLEDLRSDLGSDDVEVRRRAMRTLTEYEFVPPPKEMLRATQDPDKLMRVMAVRYLGRIRWRNGIVFLEMLLHHHLDRDEAEEVRGAVVRALETQGTPAVIPMLLDALSDESQYVFRLTVHALRTLTGRCFTDDPIRPVKRSEREELEKRWWGFWAGPRALAKKLDAIEDLERFRVHRFTPYLFPLLTDESRRVAARARRAFHAITGVLPGKDEDLETTEGRSRIRKAAVAALSELRKVRKKGEEGKGGKKPE